MTRKRPAWLLALAFICGLVASPGARAQDKQPITIGFGMGLTGGLAAAGNTIRTDSGAPDSLQNGADGRPARYAPRPDGGAYAGNWRAAPTTSEALREPIGSGDACQQFISAISLIAIVWSVFQVC